MAETAQGEREEWVAECERKGERARGADHSLQFSFTVKHQCSAIFSREAEERERSVETARLLCVFLNRAELAERRPQGEYGTYSFEHAVSHVASGALANKSAV